MDKTTIVRTAVAGGVAGLGLAVGGITVALAADDAPTTSPGARPAAFGDRGDHHGPFGGELAATLAEDLGVTEATVTAALEAVRDDVVAERGDLADGERPAPPTEAEREALRGDLAQALADELGVEAAAVEDALDGLHADMEAGMREGLADRLDDAIDDGDLTEADKASVLKAFDAGVLGGGFGPGGPRG